MIILSVLYVVASHQLMIASTQSTSGGSLQQQCTSQTDDSQEIISALQQLMNSMAVLQIDMSELKHASNARLSIYSPTQTTRGTQEYTAVQLQNDANELKNSSGMSLSTSSPTQKRPDNMCATTPCKNGGQCAPSGNSSYTCTCIGAFNGTNCDIHTLCAANPCRNGGQCAPSGSTYNCTCVTGFTGPNCETNNLCASKPCRNGGQCAPSGDNYTCNCETGFTGRNCETNNLCAPLPCMNGGRCSPSGNTYICTCVGGWSGGNCQAYYTNKCSSNPCRNGGTCTNYYPHYYPPHYYLCSCPPGYTGQNCQIDRTRCLSQSPVQRQPAGWPDIDQAACESRGWCFDSSIVESSWCFRVSVVESFRVQRHVADDQSFNRTWAEFKAGFEDTKSNYWIGNDRLSALTQAGGYHMRFDVQSKYNGRWYYADYSTFVVGNESTNYQLQAGGYSGNAGECVTNGGNYNGAGYIANDLNGMKFTTYDRDNDVAPTVNCASRGKGGFWYRACTGALVNSARTDVLGFSWWCLPINITANKVTMGLIVSQMTLIADVNSPYQINITAGDVLTELYVDEVNITNLDHDTEPLVADTVSLQFIPSVIAVSALNVGGQMKGILASESLGHVTNSSWRCTGVFSAGWMNVTFDDSGWTEAVQRSVNCPEVGGIPSTARWIWSSNVADDKVYCRCQVR